ncbi:MAG: site-specific integrase, partial [Erythrobacter sp.]|nr:site-specific integrase [Erythrobacter sp.]
MSAAGARADLIAHWRSHLAEARRLSPHTVRAYVSAAQRLIHARDLSEWSEIAALEAHDLRAHLATRRAEGLGNSSAARELSALKALITYARAQSGDP